MTPRSSPTDNPLVLLLRAWERRRRLAHTIYWLGRSLVPGLGIGVVLGLLSRVRPFLSNGEILLASLVGIAAGLVAMLVWAWLWPRPLIASARFFDRQFGLQERLATALELLEGRIHARESIKEHQLEDTYQRAAAIDLRRGLPLTARRLDWLAVALLAVLLLPLVLLPNDLLGAERTSTVQQQLVAEAADEVRDTIEDLATDSTLDGDDRRELLETLQANLETLQNEEISLEEALATLDDIAAMFGDEAGQLQNDIESRQEALQAATESLRDPTGELSEGEPDQRSIADAAAESLSEAAQGLDTMSEQALRDLAEALREAADALEEMSPSTAELLREAAESIERGDLQAAREALEESAESIRENERQQQNLQELAERFQESAEQMQQMQQMMNQEPAPPGDEAGTEEDSGQGEQAGQSGEQSAESAPGSSESDSVQPGSTFAEESQVGEAGSLQSGDLGSAESDQVGMMPGGLNEDTSGFDPSGEEPVGGPPPGEEQQYEAIFAPRRPDVAQGDDTMRLPSDAEDAPLIQGDLEENPTGDVTVPYNEVFSAYEGAANSALDQGYIPLGLRDVVRDYFTSLAPRRSVQNN